MFQRRILFISLLSLDTQGPPECLGLMRVLEEVDAEEVDRPLLGTYVLGTKPVF